MGSHGKGLFHPQFQATILFMVDLTHQDIGKPPPHPMIQPCCHMAKLPVSQAAALRRNSSVFRGGVVADWEFPLENFLTEMCFFQKQLTGEQKSPNLNCLGIQRKYLGREEFSLKRFWDFPTTSRVYKAHKVRRTFGHEKPNKSSAGCHLLIARLSH